jgi:tetratricopeptide (TPR) repeat protein
MTAVPVLLLIVSVSLLGERISPAERAVTRARESIEQDKGKVERYNELALSLARRARDTADPKDYEKAAEAIAQALSLEPDNFESLKLKAWVLLGKHEFAQALELAKELNRRVPDDATVYGLLTDAHVELGNYQEAEEAAQWMLNLGRASIPGLTRAAYLREIFGDVEGALELMTTAFSRISATETQDRAWTLSQIGHLLTLSGKLDQAAEVLGEALKLYPDYHYALANLAKVRARQELYQEAVPLLRRRYEVAPHPENLFELGAALHRAGKVEEASKAFIDFEQAAVAESKSWDNANRELVAYYADYAKKPESALRIAKLEISRRKDVATLDAYAWALYRSGKDTEAREAIKTALAVGTVDRKILEHAEMLGVAVARK